MSDTMKVLGEALWKRGLVLEQVRPGVWVLHSSEGLIDLGPTPMTALEWLRFARRLRDAGVSVPGLEGPWEK